MRNSAGSCSDPGRLGGRRKPSAGASSSPAGDHQRCRRWAPKDKLAANDREDRSGHQDLAATKLVEQPVDCEVALVDGEDRSVRQPAYLGSLTVSAGAVQLIEEDHPDATRSISPTSSLRSLTTFIDQQMAVQVGGKGSTEHAVTKRHARSLRPNYVRAWHSAFGDCKH
jgi:hypothetical protein